MVYWAFYMQDMIISDKYFKKIVCALCDFSSTGHPDNIMTDVRRQMRQCEVMLKSAVAFTNNLLRYARAFIYS